jgi:inner membrane protein
MASLGHIAVGMAAARFESDRRARPWKSIALWSAVSLLPDLDVIGFALGVDYGDPWGHRGATHSLAFAIGVGLAAGSIATWFRRPFSRTALLATAVLASHTLLDTLTDGGLGCALFWPFDLTRYFAPWNPLPVAPIGLSFFSVYGLTVALVEVVVFGPVAAYALWPPGGNRARLGAVLSAAWIAGLWLVTSHDAVRESIVGFVLREKTEYASGFSERALSSIKRGQSEEEVRHALGLPLREYWFYGFDDVQQCGALDFDHGIVVGARDEDACLDIGIGPGTPTVAVQSSLGQPADACWQYTGSAGGFYRERRVCFRQGKVVSVYRHWAGG